CANQSPGAGPAHSELAIGCIGFYRFPLASAIQLARCRPREPAPTSATPLCGHPDWNRSPALRAPHRAPAHRLSRRFLRHPTLSTSRPGSCRSAKHRSEPRECEFHLAAESADPPSPSEHPSCNYFVRRTTATAEYVDRSASLGLPG